MANWEIIGGFFLITDYGLETPIKSYSENI